MPKIKFIKKNNYIIPTKNGSQLEVLLDVFDNNNDDFIILLHPHPCKQGTMHNKVISTAARFCNQNKISNIRFNFRGVGKSSGSFGNLIGELEDAIFIYEWIKEKWSSKNISVIGFSFGAAIGYLLAQKKLINKILLLSPALNLIENNLDILPPQTLCHLVHSRSDEIIKFATINSLLAKIESINLSKTILDDVTHFYHKNLDLVYNACKFLFCNDYKS